MNPATEIVLRWYFDVVGLAADIADELVSALAKGCDAGEADSIVAVAEFVEKARDVPQELPIDEVGRLALVLHDEFVEVEAAEHNLERFREIDRLLQDVPEGLIGKRVVATRIKKLVSEMV